MAQFWYDLKHGWRTLSRQLAITTISVLTLAVGIGSSTVVYSWMQATLFHPLSGVPSGNELAVVETIMPSGEYHTSSYPDLRDYRAQNHVFSDMIGFEIVHSEFRGTSDTQAQRAWGQIVTANFFDVLGVSAERGRTFTTGENTGVGEHPVIILSDGLWRRRFAADPAIIGKTIDLDQHPFTVIGIAPRGFNGTFVGLAMDYWVPMMAQPQVLPGEDLEERHPTFVHMMGRLKPGATISQAQAEFSTIAEQLARAYPDSNKDVGVWVAPLWKAHYGGQQFLLPVLTVLMAVVLVVLLIGCVNVANLLLARANSRTKEIAVRAALGASRARLMSQLLAESLLLALIGGSAGLLAAGWGVSLLTYFLPPAHLPFHLDLGIDARVVSFALLLSLAAAFIFGFVPALEATKPQRFSALREVGRTTTASSHRSRLRSILVVSEVGLAVVMMISAALLARSLRNLSAANPGYDAENLHLYWIDLRSNGYNGAASQEFFDRLIERVRALPGVQSAASERWVPLWFEGRGWQPVTVEGYIPKANEFMGADYNVVGANYFATLKIPLVSGRDFTESDRSAAPRVVVVNQTMANRFWPDRDPLGRRINVAGEWRTVVGVARDIKYHSMQETPEPFLYLPGLQVGGTDDNILIRSTLSQGTLLRTLGEQVRALDPNVPILENDEVSALVHVSLFANRIAASLAGILAAVGLLLAALGIYGVISHGVARRTQEIGIRLALGAQRPEILGLIISQGMRPVFFGVVLGIAAGFGAGRLLESQLYGVPPADPITFISVSAVLAAIALLACLLPARRATKVDPIVALRYE
jgi:predicted permease